MARITPRTCLWPLVICLCLTFALSIGLTYRSNRHCYAGTCGEWLFPLQARAHVVTWYLWISISVLFLGLRAFQSRIRTFVSTATGAHVPLTRTKVRYSGVLLVLWVCTLYGIIIGIWWRRLSSYFQARGESLPGNNIVAAVALTGHLADVTMGMVLLPVSRHSALTSFFKLAPGTTYVFHMTQAYVLLGLVTTHGILYAAWAAAYNQQRDLFRTVLPVLNPTYLYNEVWPGNGSALGVWRASLIFTGICATVIMFAMFFTSFPAIRQKHFNLFYFTHLLGIGAVIIICLHASTMLYCTLPGLSMWVLDWTMRLFELRDKIGSRLTALGNGWYSLTLDLPRKRVKGCSCHSPLAHFYIHHSESSLREIHPFTTITHLASQEVATTGSTGSISIQFLFRESTTSKSLSRGGGKHGRGKQWTNKLASLVEERSRTIPEVDTAAIEKGRDSFPTGSELVTNLEAQTTLRLEGPYFTPANPEKYKNVVCLVAGTGLSGAVAIAAAFHAQKQRPVFSCEAPGVSSTDTCTMPSKSSGRWQRCIVIWTVKETEFVEMPFFDHLTTDGLEIQVHQTGGGRPRPDMKKIVREACDEAGDDAWCYISGPGGFMSAAEEACTQVKGLTWFAARWD